jgi:hypothetical protein
MADEKVYGTPVKEVFINGEYHKIEGSGSGGLTEISTQYIRITDLESGVYKLTYNGTKYLYYSGPVSTLKLTIASNTGHTGPVVLTVSKFDDLHWQWNYIAGGMSTSLPTINYGYSYSNSEKTSGGGSFGSKSLNSLLTSHQTMYYRPIQVNGTQILANTASTALNLANDGSVKFYNAGNGKVYANATVSVSESDKANYLHTIRITLDDDNWSFDFDLLLPKRLQNILDDNADSYGSTGTGWSNLANQIGFCSYGCLIFAILCDMFDENDTIIPVRNVCPENSSYNYGIRLTGGGTTVYSDTDYSGVATNNYSTLQIIRWLKSSPQGFNNYTVVATYNMQALSEDSYIQFYFTLSDCLYPNEHAYD